MGGGAELTETTPWEFLGFQPTLLSAKLTSAFKRQFCLQASDDDGKKERKLMGRVVARRRTKALRGSAYISVTLDLCLDLSQVRMPPDADPDMASSFF